MGDGRQSIQRVDVFNVYVNPGPGGDAPFSDGRHS